MDRRQFLRHSALVVTAVGAVPVLQACSARSSASGDTTTVRVAALGNPTDTLDLGAVTGAATLVALYNLWDSLADLTDKGVELQLAESITSNADATEWTVTLRPGLRFHNGDSVTADDVLASLRHFSQSTNFAQFLTDIDFDTSTARDERTAVLRLRTPRGDFLEATLAMVSLVMPKGDPTSKVGSGPFRFASGDAATGYVLDRNDDYWAGRPPLERLEIRGIDDPTARMNALTSGEVDYVTELGVTAAETMRSNPGVSVLRGGSAGSKAYTLELNTRMAPFDDPDVRRAAKLAVDRDQLVAVVMRGQGSIGNDIIGQGLPGYNAALPQRTRDVAEARRIFAAKGVRELRLRAAETASGILAAATLLVQQFADAGVTLTIDQADPATFYADYGALLKEPFLALYYINRPVAATLPFTTGATSPYNFSGFSTPEYQRLLDQAAATVDAAERTDLYNRAQQILWEQGGEVVWGFQEVIDGARAGLTGVRSTQSIPLFAAASYT